MPCACRPLWKKKWLLLFFFLFWLDRRRILLVLDDDTLISWNNIFAPNLSRIQNSFRSFTQSKPNWMKTKEIAIPFFVCISLCLLFITIILSFFVHFQFSLRSKAMRNDFLSKYNKNKREKDISMRFISFFALTYD